MSELPKFRLFAEFPHGILPELFGVITAAAPQKLLREDRLHGSILSDALRIKGWTHFPAEVVLPSSDEPRVSFAVVENLAKLERLARDFIRPGIFWVQRGEVIQMFFGQKPPKPLGSWNTFSGHTPATLHASGNFALLKKTAAAFLCSTACPGDKILEAYEWARHRCDTGGTVMSGFHTPVEKDVLAILARRGANFIWVPDTPSFVHLNRFLSHGAVRTSSGCPGAIYPRPSTQYSERHSPKTACSSFRRFSTASPPARP